MGKASGVEQGTRYRGDAEVCGEREVAKVPHTCKQAGDARAVCIGERPFELRQTRMGAQTLAAAQGDAKPVRVNGGRAGPRRQWGRTTLSH